MSNKPPVYGFCPAGCKWETVHKEDWLNNIPLVKQNAGTYTNPNTDAAVPAYILDKKEVYKLVDKGNDISWGFTIKVNYSVSGNVLSYSIPITAKVSSNIDTVYFEMIDVIDSVDLQQSILKIIYRLNGEIVTFIEDSPQTYRKESIEARIEEVDDCDCYLVNDGNISIDPTTNTERILKEVEDDVYTIEFNSFNNPIYRHNDVSKELATKEYVDNAITTALGDDY